MKDLLKVLYFIGIVVGIFIMLIVSEMPKSDAQRKIIEAEKQEKVEKLQKFYECRDQFGDRLCVRFNSDINAINSYYKLPLDTLNP